MNQITLEALGTKWEILIDQKNLLFDTTEVKKIITTFEQNYSRFKPESLVSQINAGKKIKQTTELQRLIAFGKELEVISEGYFQSQPGSNLARLGYGSGTQGLDFGAYGKGFLIDKVAEYLQKNNCLFFLINAGGDIFATEKSNQDSWKVALEHPTSNNTAIGTVLLKNKALAASSPFKRSWNKNTQTNNHLINGKTGESITQSRAVFVISDTAQVADGLATTLNIVPYQMIVTIAKKFNVEYLVFDQQGTMLSTHFNANLFTNSQQ